MFPATRGAEVTFKCLLEVFVYNFTTCISSNGRLNYFEQLSRTSWDNYESNSRLVRRNSYCNMSSINHYVSLQSMNATSLVPTGSSVSVWWLSTQRGERPVKRRSAGNKESGETASFPLSLGSYFWGLSSGSFKWGLVTAGTSWTKLLLPAPLLCCSHSPLIGFDCICLNPQWKKEKGGWRGCSETEVCQFVQTRWHFRKKKRRRGLPLPGLIKQRLGVRCLLGHRAGLVSRWLEQADPGLCLHMHNHLWWSQLISSVSGSTDTLCTAVHGHPHRHVTHEHVHKHS